jgi:molybdopterin converting factor subunit 1
MHLTVRFFTTLKERVGASKLDIHAPESVSVKNLLAALVREQTALEPARESIIIAVNQEFPDPDQVLTPDDEIVFIPPVSGG